MDCYVPNNPQFGVALEYLPGCGQHCGDLVNCSCHLDLGGRPSCCEDDLENCCQQSQDLNALSESILPDSPCLVNEDGTVNEPQWNEDMASFSLPTLELDPLPSLLSFSPCAGYKNNGGDCRERGGGEGAADVLLSLKHAVVHSDCSSDATVHPQMMVNNGYPYYEHYGSGPIFPTMSVNVSMNMTMHGCAPDQLCSQVQWNQNAPPSLNVVYPPNQNVISSTAYPSATYSFTADFRPPKQSDPLITASNFKPLQLQSPQRQPLGNYPFLQKQNFSSKISPPIKRGLKFQEEPRIDQNGFAIINHQGQMPQDYGYATCLSSPGNALVSPQSGESEDDESKPNLCRICGKTYARPSTLKTHLRTHSGERPYRCGDCNKSFSQAANLTAHVRTHTGQKPFRCPICDRRFSQSSSVTTHMRTHSGERPYQCRSCKKAFSDSSTLTKHLRIHSGEKPYQCKLCLLRFSQSGNLNRHMRVHGNVPGAMVG